MLLSGPNLTLFAEVEDAEPGSPVSRFPRRRFKFPHAGCHPSHGGTHPASDGLPDPARPGAASPGSHAAAAAAPAAAAEPEGPRDPQAENKGGRAKWRPRYKMAAGRAVAWGRCPRARPGFLPTLSMSSRACARHIPVNPGGPPSVDGQVRAHTGAELRRTGFGDP